MILYQQRVKVSQRQYQEYVQPSHGQEEAGQVPPLSDAADDVRHLQVVQHHGTHRHGGDEYHSRGGGDAPDEDQQRQKVVTLIDGDGDHEHVGRSRRIQEETCPGHRRYEEVYEQHVEGDEPHGLLEVVLVGVLHHHDVKLPREKEYGEE